jgi:hypothetical protein
MVHLQKQPEDQAINNSAQNCDAEPEASVVGEPCTPVRKKRPITRGRGGPLGDSSESADESDCQDVHIQNVHVPGTDEDSEWDEFIVQQA